MLTISGLTAFAFLLCVGSARAQDLAGTYVMTAQNATLTLVLRQTAQGGLSGTLSSTRGGQFQVEGTLRDGVGVGTCVGSQGGSYFEARPAGKQLRFALIEPGPDNAPDYSTVRHLLFVRQASGPSAQPPDTRGRGKAGPPAGDEVSDPAWAFAFRLPAGWKVRKDNQGALLGHDTVPGLILVLPHTAGTTQELQRQMQQGLQEPTLRLVPAGRLQPMGTNAVAGEYTGVADGAQVNARGIGVVGPQGGGAYIVALAAPSVYGSALTTAAEAIARSLRTVPQDASDLVRHFAGTWVTMTQTTQTMVTLHPNGTFAHRYDAGYSGGQTGSWGLAREDHAQGRWTVRGTTQQGVLVLTNPDGSQTPVRYQVHVERGQTYWKEYYFNGELYGKQ